MEMRARTSDGFNREGLSKNVAVAPLETELAKAIIIQQ